MSARFRPVDLRETMTEDAKTGEATSKSRGSRPDPIWAFLSSNITADSDTGVFRLFDQRLLVLRPEALVDLQKHLEQTVGLSSKGFLYLAGEKSGQEGHALFRSLIDSVPASEDELGLLTRSFEALSLLGWGRFAVTALDVVGHRYRVTLDRSPIAEAYGDSKKPVCHLVAGWLAGIAQSVLGRSLLCEETACSSQGMRRCEFQLKPMPSA